MMYMITRASIINKCNMDGKLHLLFSAAEKPCKEAMLREIKNTNDELCSRYFIDIQSSIEEIDKLGNKYNVDVLVTKNLEFPDYISLVLYDEEIIQIEQV